MAEHLDPKKIRQGMERDCELVIFEKTDSTNEQALARVKQGQSLPFACFAEQQTQGRGRRGKVWISPPACSIYMSLAWRFELPVNGLGCLSLAIGVAVARVLRNVGVLQVGIKWPNDVLVDDKKIAGILIETSQLESQASTAIIGIGLNYNLPDDLVDVPAQPWTDVVSSMSSDFYFDRSQVASLLLQECLTVCESFVETKSTLMLEYQQHYDVCLQQVVNVYLEQQVLQGVVVGFGDDGEIKVLIDGEQRSFNSAEISLGKTK